MLAADTIAINRLQVSGDKRSNEKLVRDIAQTSWSMPLPAHLQQAWVLVRQLKVEGKLQHLRQATARQLDSQLQHAVSAHQSNAKNSDAIWFESFPVLLAFLLRDLALDQAAQWYWERWSYLLKYPRQEAITRLMCEHTEHLSSVFNYLIKSNSLALVFKQLTPASAKTIVKEIVRVCQLPPLSEWIPDQKFASNFIEIKTNLISLRSLLTSWRPLLAGYSIQDGRFLLAACVIGINYSPLYLGHQPAFFIHELAELFTANNEPSMQLKEREPADEHQIEITPSIIATKNKFKPIDTLVELIQPKEKQIRSDSKQDNPAHLEEIVTSDYATTRINNTAQKESAEPRLNNSTYGLRDQKQRKNKNVNPEISLLDETTAKSSETSLVSDLEPLNTIVPVGNEFYTQAGGFFYLLNPISRLLTRDLLNQQRDANPWHWLFDLYRLFKNKFTLLNTIDDASLIRFMLSQIMPSAETNDLKELQFKFEESTPSAFSELLFTRLSYQFCESTFWKELNQSAGFFNTPARVITNPSHIDVYFSLQSVRVDLRISAWDINPGWLIWLGRVVNLHYLEQGIEMDIDKNKKANIGEGFSRRDKQ